MLPLAHYLHSPSPPRFDGLCFFLINNTSALLNAGLFCVYTKGLIAMARPSKLTQSQWDEILKRVVSGEVVRALAREYGVSESTIRDRVSAQAAEIKSVANQIVSVDRAMDKLPVSAQITAQNYAQQLRAISDNLTNAAVTQSHTSMILSGFANRKAASLNEFSGEDDYKELGIKIKLANEASAVPVALLNANKKTVEGFSDAVEVDAGEMPTDNIAASRAYQKMLNG